MFCREMDSDNNAPCFSLAGLVWLSVRRPQASRHACNYNIARNDIDSLKVANRSSHIGDLIAAKAVIVNPVDLTITAVARSPEAFEFVRVVDYDIDAVVARRLIANRPPVVEIVAPNPRRTGFSGLRTNGHE